MTVQAHRRRCRCGTGYMPQCTAYRRGLEKFYFWHVSISCCTFGGMCAVPDYEHETNRLRRNRASALGRHHHMAKSL